MNSYNVYSPSIEYYQQNIPCQTACPVRTDGRAYVNAIARGEYEKAYLIARETNPFASTCGWICGAPCEAACRRGKIDEPVAIRALKRFVNDKYGVYIGEEGKPQSPPSWPTYIKSSTTFDLGNTDFPTSRGGLVAARKQLSKSGKKVAIIGSGPSGLSCAHDLALLGHDVVIYEASLVSGGMLRMGIPEYRLPRELIDLEIQSILALGPEIKLNTALGKDISLKSLRSEFDAVFVAIGTYQSRNLNIEGEQLDGVLRAVDFLINVNLGGYNLDLGKKVLIIGGGSVAMDVARTAARLGHDAESGGDLEIAIDVARTAIRLGSTEEVHCLVIEDSHQMLADPIEILEAKEEGVVIHNHVAPKRILGDGKKAISIETLNVSSAFDEKGKFNPQLIPGSEKIWEFDSVVVAIGQFGDLNWINPDDGIELNANGSLIVDPSTLSTTAKGVFAGGDIAFGPRLVINAVADGQKAARNIHSYMQGLTPKLKRKAFFTPIPKKDYAKYKPIRNYLRFERMPPPSIPVNRRIGVSLVEAGYQEEDAVLQSSRCLICSINPIFDGEKCILCNGCVDVCPMNCLKLVSVNEIVGDIHVEFYKKTTEGIAINSAMLFDPDLCIRCGLCADRCPTEAVKMETFKFSEKIIFDKENSH